MLNKKLVAVHITGLILLIAFTKIVISYSNFEFEIPFFLRTNIKNNNNQSTLEGSELSPTVPPTEDIINLQNIINPDDLIDNVTNSDSLSDALSEDYPEATSSTATEPDFHANHFADELKNQGYYISDGIYEKKGSEYDYVFGRVELESSSIPQEQYIFTNGENVNVIESVMGFFTVRSSNNVALYTSSGKIVSESFLNLGMKISGKRDENNNPVFAYDYNAGISQETEEDEPLDDNMAYFVYDPNIKSFLQTGYNDIYGDRGIPFAYPSYYGAPGNKNMSRYMNADGKWGYIFYDTAEVAVYASYDKTFNYSDDTGIAYKTESKGNRLYFLDENGDVLNDKYFAPDNPELEHLGFFYFEKGLTRVYSREFDNQGRLIVERDILVDKHGNEFYIPEDYTIKAYSNGAVLLEKDNYYGFMSYDGNWIAQPIFTYAQPFYEGVAVIGFENGKKALIDAQGNIILKFNYEHLSNCSGGVVAAYEKEKGWSVFAKMRK